MVRDDDRTEVVDVGDGFDFLDRLCHHEGGSRLVVGHLGLERSAERIGAVDEQNGIHDGGLPCWGCGGPCHEGEYFI